MFKHPQKIRKKISWGSDTSANKRYLLDIGLSLIAFTSQITMAFLSGQENAIQSQSLMALYSLVWFSSWALNALSLKNSGTNVYW